MRTRKVIIAGVVIVALAATYIAAKPEKPSTRMINSPQYHDSGFRNPGANIDFSFTTMVSSLRAFLFEKKNTKPKWQLPKQAVDLTIFESRSENYLGTTWLGHSSLMINIDGLKLLADPVLEKSVSFFGPTRYNGEAPITPEQIPEVDLVLISHNHYDHLNKYTIERIHQKSALFISPLGVKKFLVDWGVPESKVIELDWWEKYRVSDKLDIVLTPAQHFSGRGMFDRNKTLWGSYVIKSANHNIFFGGDSGYFDGFTAIGEKHGPFDMTFLECGAYDKRWHPIHLMPEETAQAHLDLRGELLHPIHWGTFDLALHEWNDPMKRLVIAAEETGIRITTPIAGGSVVYGEDEPVERWWEKASPK